MYVWKLDIAVWGIFDKIWLTYLFIYLAVTVACEITAPGNQTCDRAKTWATAVTTLDPYPSVSQGNSLDWFFIHIFSTNNTLLRYFLQYLHYFFIYVIVVSFNINILCFNILLFFDVFYNITFGNFTAFYYFFCLNNFSKHFLKNSFSF